MSKVLSLDFEFEHDYALIGIHSALEDYRLAFFLNQNLNLKLTRLNEDLDFSLNDGLFSVFQHDDKDTYTDWALIANKCNTTTLTQNLNSNLFNEDSQIYYLIPERKKVDYFIKISGSEPHTGLQRILTKINHTYNVITSYEIDPLGLKSKDNLIF